MKEHNIIISSSKDTFVKFWDLDTEHNFKTLIGHRSEVSCSILVYILSILFLVNHKSNLILFYCRFGALF